MSKPEPVFARVSPDDSCPLSQKVDDAGDPVAETWAEWFTNQYPHIAPAAPGDGYLYFELRPGGVPMTKEQVKALPWNVKRLTANQYREATYVPHPL